MGPLAGFRVVEIAGIGPTPMAAMLLADLGATVLRIDRPAPGDIGIPKPTRFDLLNRGRRSVAVDLKQSEGIEAVLQLVERADALIEGFRPGTMERLGLGPDICLARNPRLVYGRMTGWGQTGPLAHSAGHDLDYIALSGALAMIGRDGQPPTPPLNLVGDFAGGSLYLVLGMLSALLERGRSGLGQVVDAAMVDGAASLLTPFYGMRAAGMHDRPRGNNMLDSGAPFYDVYQCADGGYLAVAPIEKKFRAEFYQLLGLDASALPDADDRANWPALKALIGERLRLRSRDAWSALFAGTDACCAPVLAPEEAPQHPHNAARGNFVEIDGVVQPAPAPQFSRSQPTAPSAPEAAGASTGPALRDWGFSDDQIERLRQLGAIGTK